MTTVNRALLRPLALQPNQDPDERAFLVFWLMLVTNEAFLLHPGQARVDIPATPTSPAIAVPARSVQDPGIITAAATVNKTPLQISQWVNGLPALQTANYLPGSSYADVLAAACEMYQNLSINFVTYPPGGHGCPPALDNILAMY
jgi:hypothetical protein